jgi:hypothetical protein
MLMLTSWINNVLPEEMIARKAHTTSKFGPAQLGWVGRGCCDSHEELKVRAVLIKEANLQKGGRIYYVGSAKSVRIGTIEFYFSTS